MKKQEFITELRKRLSPLSQCDIDKYSDYYSEMIDDRIEDGLSEEEAVNDLGSFETIVSQLLADTPKKQPAQDFSTNTEKNKLPLWCIILIAILTSPIWISIISSAAGAVFSVIIVVFSFVIMLYAVDFAFAACGFVSLIASIPKLVEFDIIQSAFCFGSGLILIGLSIILFFGANWIARKIIQFTKFIIRKISKLFAKRGVSA